jgi:hypothetical protein
MPYTPITTVKKPTTTGGYQPITTSKKEEYTPVKTVAPKVLSFGENIKQNIKDVISGGDETYGGAIRNTILGIPKAFVDVATHPSKLLEPVKAVVPGVFERAEAVKQAIQQKSWEPIKESLKKQLDEASIEDMVPMINGQFVKDEKGNVVIDEEKADKVINLAIGFVGADLENITGKAAKESAKRWARQELEKIMRAKAARTLGGGTVIPKTPTGVSVVKPSASTGGVSGVSMGGVIKSIPGQAPAMGLSTQKVENVGGEEKNLLVVHNLSEQKLRFADRIGGLSNPSTAVINPNVTPFENYGDISLIGDRNLIEGEKTRLADAYTARFPSVHSSMSYDDFDKLKADIAPYEKEAGDTRTIYHDDSDMIRQIENSPAVALKFLKENGITPSPEGYSYYHSQIQKEGLDGKFQVFLDDLYKKYNLQEKLFAGYTNSGQRRYKPVTVDEASKIMGKQKDEGYNYGLGSIRSKIAPTKTSTSAIKKEAGRLISKENFEEIKKSYDDELFNLKDKLSEYAVKTSDNQFIESDNQLNAIGELLMGQKDAMYYFRNKFPDAPQDIVDEVIDFRDKLKKMPTEYFETKFKRPVKLSEFKIALVPDTITPEAKAILEKQGLEVREYAKGEKAKAMQDLLRTDIAFTKKRAYNVGDEISNKIPLKLPAIQAPSEAESVKRLGGNDATSKGFVDIRGKTAKSMEELAAILKDFRNPSREILHFVYLSKDGNILAHTAITSNRIDLVQMTKKEFSFKLQDRAKKLGADTIYMAHNHPSGNVEPSQADEAILLKAAMGNELVKGSIILDHNKATFMKIDKSNKPIVGIDTTQKPIDLGKSYEKSDQRISSPKDFLTVAQKQHAFDSGKVGIFTVSTDMQLQDYQTIKINPDKIEETIRQFIKASDAHYAFIALRQDEARLLPSLDVLDIAVSDGKDIFSLKQLGNIDQFKTSQPRFKENYNSIRLFEKEGRYDIQNELSEIENTIESELGISEEELNQAVAEYNQITPKIGKTVSKTPMKDFVAKLSPAEFAALKPDQQAYAMKYATGEAQQALESEMLKQDVKSGVNAEESLSGEAGTIESSVKEVLSGKRKINLAERKSEFRAMFGDKLYYKINDPKAGPLDEYIEFINNNLSQRIEIDDFLEAMYRAVKQQEALKPIQLKARRDFREARQEQIKRRFTLEQVAKKIEKERAVKTQVVQKIIEQKYKAEQELKNLVQISKSRKEKIDTIQDYFGLTDFEMSKVQGRKDIRTMNEAEFNQFLHEVSNKAQMEAELADARAQVKGTIYSKELVGWENLRKAMSYPSLDQMSIEQLKEFDRVLSQYESQDEFLSQRKLETIDKTDFKGVKTLREARAKVAQKLGVDPSKLDIGVSEFDRMRFDTALAERNPFYRYFVEGFNASILEGEAVFLEQVNKINELFGKVKGRGKFVPQDKKIMQYLESADKEAVAKTMTPEEIVAAEYVRLHLQEAYKYELETKMLKGSRYEDLYLPHIQRTFLEAVKDSGIRQAFREMFKQHQIDEKIMTILDQKTGEILPYEKFFRFALRRSGEVIPTQNVARAFLQYMKAFERKRALDRIIPEIMTAVDVVSPREMTEKGLAMDDRIKTFVTEYLNTKKGRPVKMFVKPGGTVDFILKSVKTFTNMMDLAINIPLQLGSRGGTMASTYVEIGPKKYLTGEYRLRTKQGKEILKRFENFTGRTPFDSFLPWKWNILKDTDRGAVQKMQELMFSLFRDATVKANKTFLLGNLTPEEFATGIITPQRLASLQTDLGRWLPVEGSKSILGSTVEGGLATQYRTWAIPIVRTTLKNLADLARMIKSKEFKKAGKSREFMELFRVAQVTGAVALIAMAVDYDPNKKNQSFLEKTLSNAIRDALSIVSAYDPNTWMNGIRILSFTESLMKALSDIVRLTEYKASGSGYKKGDLKGIQEMQNLFTPSIMKQLFPAKKKSTTIKGGLMF